ncbi:MAG: sugar ABC transporter permease [Treponema sp.]|jgi:raffinose/stachyose/melibiose transport system permease protein|nr:sugar ABC transporter permease [Treponema sp.]
MGGLKFRTGVVLFLVPALVLYVLFFVYPFFTTVLFSFTDWNGFTTPAFVGIKNYVTILTDAVFQASLVRVFVWVIAALIFKVGFALVIAFVLRKKMRGIRFFRTIVFIPYIISSAAMCLMFSIMYDKEIGFVNILLRAVGLDGIIRYWLADPKTAFGAVIAIPIYQAIGYFFVILFAAMQDVPEDLYEAGRIDGTNSLQEFFYITLPMIWKTLAVCITLSINGTFQNYDYIFILTYGGPNHASEVPATYMYKALFTRSEYGFGGAAAMVIFVCVLALTIFVRKTAASCFSTE